MLRRGTREAESGGSKPLAPTDEVWLAAVVLAGSPA